MKKFLAITLMGLFLGGCGTAAQRSEFWKHDTVYKSWDHLKYSWGGYKNPTEETLNKSQEQGWWGIPIQK
jgi:hypothetical protein